MSPERVVAHLSERVEEGEDPCEEWCTARFDGHLEGGPSGRLDGATLTRALAWAREHADVAVVRLAGDPTGYWAAGEAPPKRWQLEPLPDDRLALVRRRPPGRAWCDRSERDPQVEWPASATLARKVASSALEEHPDVLRARAGRGRAVRVVVRASTRAQAARTAHDACAAVVGEPPTQVWVGPPDLPEAAGGPDAYTRRRWG